MLLLLLLLQSNKLYILHCFILLFLSLSLSTLDVFAVANFFPLSICCCCFFSFWLQLHFVSFVLFCSINRVGASARNRCILIVDRMKNASIVSAVIRLECDLRVVGGSNGHTGLLFSECLCAWSAEQSRHQFDTLIAHQIHALHSFITSFMSDAQPYRKTVKPMIFWLVWISFGFSDCFTATYSLVITSKQLEKILHFFAQRWKVQLIRMIKLNELTLNWSSECASHSIEWDQNSEKFSWRIRWYEMQVKTAMAIVASGRKWKITIDSQHVTQLNVFCMRVFLSVQWTCLRTAQLSVMHHHFELFGSG